MNIIIKNHLVETIHEKIISFYKQPNQMTNILRMLRVIIDFIVSSRSHNNMKIFDYASEVLKMKLHTENNDVCKEVIFFLKIKKKKVSIMEIFFQDI